ncbi:MAG: AAA family ATPase [Anaerolineae bacterium]|nr:AAA family ATPase [Anaerolineae bacterium]
MTLVTTKLSMPVLRRDLVHRSRLIEILSEGLLGPDHQAGFARRLTLVAAPAGFGKTTLVRVWVEGLRSEGAAQIAWLSLDEGDSDVVRFWTYVIAALQAALAGQEAGSAPGFAATALALLAPGELAQPPTVAQTEAGLAALINDLSGLDARLLLVLDDYHLIDLPAIHRGLGFLLDHMPPQLHLVIASRADPLFPLSRLRARNQMAEVRAGDLAFTAGEAAAFLVKTMGLSLPGSALTALTTTTEGWVTGLQMAALALRSATARSEGVPDLVTGLAQSRRYSLDYLADEVLAELPEDLQSFLLQTSILDTITGPLCDAVTADASASSATVLDQLERANLFIAPLGATRAWYRIHPLFAELLRRRLERRHPALVPVLHERASAWYESAGLMEPAIDHACKGPDLNRAADLIEREAMARLARSENATVLRWIEALPDGVVSTRPQLCAVHAWLLLINGRAPETVRERLDQAAAGATAAEARGVTSALQALLDIYQGALVSSIAHANEALAALPSENRFFRSVAAHALGMAHTSTGDLPAAVEAFETVVETARAWGNVMLAGAALSSLAGLRLLQGALHEAEAAYRQALALSTDDRGFRLPVAARALLGLGELARERNDLATATGQLEEACELSRHYGQIGLLVGLLTLGRVEIAKGDLERARALLGEAEELASATRATDLDDRLVSVSRLHLLLAEGKLDKAAAWAKAHRRRIQDALQEAETQTAFAGSGPLCRDYNLLEAEAIALARTALALRDPGQALAFLDPLSAVATRLGRTRRRIELLALSALAHNQAGRRPTALTALQQALALAAPEPFRRTFVDEGAPMRELLQELVVGSHPLTVGTTVHAYLADLLGHFDAASLQARGHELDAGEAQQPVLSPRELEVLALIAAGLTNREIGDRLYLALDTVKGHTREIYGKLDVHNRTQAVARARHLGLLPM